MPGNSFPDGLSLSLGDVEIPFSIEAEIGHMSLDEAIASGFFELPDEPGMVRIPVVIHLEITPELQAAIDQAQAIDAARNARASAAPRAGLRAPPHFGGVLGLRPEPVADWSAALLHLPSVGSAATPGEGPAGGGFAVALPPLAAAGFTPTMAGEPGAIQTTPRPNSTLPVHTGSPPPSRVDLGLAPFPIANSNLPIALDSSNPLRDKLEKARLLAPGQVAHHKVPRGGPQNGGRDPRKEQDKLADLGIDLDDIENGVGLSPEFHRRPHTKGYYDIIKTLFLKARTAAQAKKILQDLEKRLEKADRSYQKDGTLPSWSDE